MLNFALPQKVHERFADKKKYRREKERRRDGWLREDARVFSPGRKQKRIVKRERARTSADDAK